MRDAIEQLPPGGKLVVLGVTWGEYERLLGRLADRPGVRVTFDQGRLQAVSSLRAHEHYAQVMADLALIAAERLDLPFEQLGSTTLRQLERQQGVEPDRCFYIASAGRIAGKTVQQLGYSSATVRKAYPTGGSPAGDSDATTQERIFNPADGEFYFLTFAGNFFEGYIYLGAPDVAQPTAATVAPVSMGPLLGFTGCTVSPSSSDNLIAFRVLTSTYRLSQPPITYQEWGRQDQANNFITFGQEQIPLPNDNCPNSESAQ